MDDGDARKKLHTGITIIKCTIYYARFGYCTLQDVGSAVSATRSMNGFMFYARPMRVTFAKSQSHAVQKEEGTFGRPAKKSKIASQAKPAAAAAVAAATAAAKPAAAAAGDAGEAAAPMEDDQPPNNILYLSGLPENAKAEGVDIEEMLEMLFGPEAQLEGLKEVRLVSNRPDIAFVEYADEDQAAAAKDRLQGFNLTPENKLSIIYAKK